MFHYVNLAQKQEKQIALKQTLPTLWLRAICFRYNLGMYKRVHTYNRGIWAGLSTPTVAALAGVSKSKAYRYLKSISSTKDVTLEDIGIFITECREDKPEKDISSFMSTMEEIIK